MYRSEIRQSQIVELLEKVQSHNYGRYLFRAKLDKVRAFEEQAVVFDFPVTALVGPNGGGKTTILGAAACAYKEVLPRQFFAKSGRLDDSMQNWRIEYQLVDKAILPDDLVRRTSKFHSRKWYRDALSRQVLVFGVSRTVPANERVELRKCASSVFAFDDAQVERLSAEVSSAVEKILGKDVSNYTSIRVDERGRVSLLSGETPDGTSFSEFHFGAGESSIIRMVIKIEALDENCLILIEEIENGLHPIATIRMVEYLIDVAERKRAQAIFTTHSNDALIPLPSKAVWTAIDGKVYQGKPDIHALRAITGQVDTRLVIFVEDEFSKRWVECMVRATSRSSADIVEVFSMQGDSMAVKIHKHHRADPSTRSESVCFIDGESREQASVEERVFRLPGTIPERYIFNKVLERIDEECGRLAVALHLKFTDQDVVRQVAEEVTLTNRDAHMIYSQIGEKLGLISEEVVQSGFLSIWASAFPEEVETLFQPVHELIETLSRNSVVTEG
jgi:predicted ATPase